MDWDAADLFAADESTLNPQWLKALQWLIPPPATHTPPVHASRFSTEAEAPARRYAFILQITTDGCPTLHVIIRVGCSYMRTLPKPWDYISNGGGVGGDCEKITTLALKGWQAFSKCSPQTPTCPSSVSLHIEATFVDVINNMLTLHTVLLKWRKPQSSIPQQLSENTSL